MLEKISWREEKFVRKFVKPHLSFYLLLLSSPPLVLLFQQTFTGFVESWNSCV